MFLDLETTGLSRDAGTLAFLVGIAYVQGGQWHVEQWTLGQLRAEAEMLSAVAARVEKIAAEDAMFVTFNGRSFDLPLLQTRMARLGVRSRLGDLPHLDLLLVARRLWRDRLVNCRLGTIETNVLGIRRRADVSGSEIPALYWAWLQAPQRRDLRAQMERIREHNHLDLISLVLLGGVLAQRARAPSCSDEALRVARMYEAGGQLVTALSTVEAALAGLTEPSGMQIHPTGSSTGAISAPKKRTSQDRVSDAVVVRLHRTSADGSPRVQAEQRTEFRQTLLALCRSSPSSHSVLRPMSSRVSSARGDGSQLHAPASSPVWRDVQLHLRTAGRAPTACEHSEPTCGVSRHAVAEFADGCRTHTLPNLQPEATREKNRGLRDELRETTGRIEFPIYPANPSVFALLQLAADLYRRTGERVAAARCWATLCELFPGDPRAHAGLAKYLEHDLRAFAAALWIAERSATPEVRRVQRLRSKLRRAIAACDTSNTGETWFAKPASGEDVLPSACT